MIAVIADDFTGAAEIGGLGLRYHLSVEIETRVKSSTKADLLIIAMDTRSKNVEEAVQDIETITRQLMQLKPDLIYKKIDSVLRGHILPEIIAQMNISQKQKALVIPANPALGRIIKDGIYYLNGKKLHETGFRHDPGFKITSSKVIDIVQREETHDVTVAKWDDRLPARGIIIGEALDSHDFQKWLQRADSNSLLAGAASFFLAILEEKSFSDRKTNHRQAPRLGQKMLLACGSSFASSKKAVEEALAKGAPVSLMPAALAQAGGEKADDHLEQWASAIIGLFENNDRVVISSGPMGDYEDKPLAENICRQTAAVIKKVMVRTGIHELMLEGGSTAAAVLNALGIDSCYPEEELAHGVIRMSVPANDQLHITLKPGSYQWPLSIWHFDKTNTDE